MDVECQFNVLNFSQNLIHSTGNAILTAVIIITVTIMLTETKLSVSTCIRLLVTPPVYEHWKLYRCT